MRNRLLALALAAVVSLVASGTAQASLFPPYTQFIIANQLAPDAIPGDCFTVGTEPVALVHANTACGGGGGGSNFPTGITTGVQGADLQSQIGIAGGSGSGGASLTMGADSTQTCAATATAGDLFYLGNANLGPLALINSAGNLAFCYNVEFAAPGNPVLFDNTPRITVQGTNTSVLSATTSNFGFPHCALSTSAGITASSASTTVNFPSSVIFATAHYALIVNDDTVLATVPPITSKSQGSFAFTSVNTHVYSYQACGE